MQLAFLSPPFLGGFSAEVCDISPLFIIFWANDGKFAL